MWNPPTNYPPSSPRTHTPLHLSYSTCPPSGTQKAIPTLPCHPTLGAPPLPARLETLLVIVPPSVDRLCRHAMGQQDELVIMIALLTPPLATPPSLAIPRLTRPLVGQSLFLGLIISRCVFSGFPLISELILSIDRRDCSDSSLPYRQERLQQLAAWKGRPPHL